MKWFGVCLLLMVGFGAAIAQPAERSFRYDLMLDIDVQGHVSRVVLPDGMPAPFAVPLRCKRRRAPGPSRRPCVTACQ